MYLLVCSVCILLQTKLDHNSPDEYFLDVYCLVECSLDQYSLNECSGSHFSDYIYGKTVLVETDYKPRASIFQKCISLFTPRVRKMILHFHTYALKVTYKPEKNLLIADTFSRGYLKEHENKLYDVLLDVNVIISRPMTAGKLRQ